MPNTLLIVESPAKARTITKYLGKEFTVKASMGHIRDLPKSKLGVDIENDFTPSFVVSKEKKAVVGELQSAAKKASRILLAADPDREGEAICYHLEHLLKESGKPIARVLFHARVTRLGKDMSFVERSEFRHDGTGWRYLSGTALPVKGLAVRPESLTLASFPG